MRIGRKKTAVGWVLLLLGGSLNMPHDEAATFHVARKDISASHDNDGLAPKRDTQGHGPWKTLVKAAATIRAGDTVLIYDGDYRQEKSGWGTGKIAVAHSGASLDGPIAFAGAPGQKPVLKTILIHDRQWIVIRGLTFANSDYTFPTNWREMPQTSLMIPRLQSTPRSRGLLAREKSYVSSRPSWE